MPPNLSIVHVVTDDVTNSQPYGYAVCSASFIASYSESDTIAEQLQFYDHEYFHTHMPR